MSAKFNISVLLLVCCIAAAVAMPKRIRPYRPSRPEPTEPVETEIGAPCESKYATPCGEADETELITETVTQLDSNVYGPNVCRTDKVYSVPVYCMATKRVCGYKWGFFGWRRDCRTICASSGVCNCTREVTKSTYDCCDGYTYNGSDLESNRMPKSGCPIKLEETVADCLDRLNLTLLSELASQNEEGSPENDESFTIFAPTDEALEGIKLSPEMMAAHVLNKEIRSEILFNKDGKRLSSLAPDQFLHITTVGQKRSQKLFVSGVQVIIPNACFARNGVVHVIDGAIQSSSSSVADVLSSEPDLSDFNELVEKSEYIARFLNNSHYTLTLFAPTNGEIDNATMDCLCLPENKPLLYKFLQFHIVTGAEYKSTLGLRKTLVTNLCYRSFFFHHSNCQSVRVSVEGDQITVAGSDVTTADIAASNGVVHIMSKPLQNNFLNKLLAQCATQ